MSASGPSAASRVVREGNAQQLFEAFAAEKRKVFVSEERGKFFIATEMHEFPSERGGGRVLLRTEVMPHDPEAWRAAIARARTTFDAAKRSGNPKEAELIGAEMSGMTAYNPASGRHEDLIGLSMSDFFTSYREQTITKGTGVANTPNGRTQATLRQLGTFASTKALAEVAWVFPTLPDDTLLKWPALARPAPVYVMGPNGTYYPKDFGRGTVIRMWKSSTGREADNVYAVIKREMQGMSPMNRKYFGRTFQVPGWMVRDWRAMGVDAIDIENDTVLFIRANDQDGVRTNISWVMSDAKIVDNDKRRMRDQMRLALRDLSEDYDITKVFSPDVIIDAPEYVAPGSAPKPAQAPAAAPEAASEGTEVERDKVSAPMIGRHHRPRKPVVQHDDPRKYEIAS